MQTQVHAVKVKAVYKILLSRNVQIRTCHLNHFHSFYLKVRFTLVKLYKILHLQNILETT